MRKNDLMFLSIAIAVALLFAGATLSQSKALLFPSESAPALTGAAGQPRTVNPEQIRRMIEQKSLSNREADFYEPVIPE